MTLQEFGNVFGALAVQLHKTDVDAPTIRLYFEALKDVELEFVTMAAQRLAGTAEWFPKTSEWRETARRIEAERTTELRERLRKRAEPLCLACGDTGWEFDPDVNAVRRCDCAALRRLEVLGRRPMPALTDGSTRTVAVDVETVAKALASTAGMA